MVLPWRRFLQSEGSPDHLPEPRLKHLHWYRQPKHSLGHGLDPNHSPGPNLPPPGVYEERCDGRKSYLCQGKLFSTLPMFARGCVHQSAPAQSSVFKPTTKMELSSAIKACSFSSGLVKEGLAIDGDTVGGAGCTINPTNGGKATHAVIWMHGVGDTCEAWSYTLRGFFPMITHLRMRKIDLHSICACIAGMRIDMPIRFVLPTVGPAAIAINPLQYFSRC